jgi:hypothetical protein
MTYMKLVAEGSKRHLMHPDQLHLGTTLCGCVVTRELNWRRIHTLEGDECEKCAEVTFWTPSQAPDEGER